MNDAREMLLSILAPQPQMPPINRLSPADLERMQFAAMQSGDTARAQRIAEVKAMRAAEMQQQLPPEVQSQLLGSQPQQRGSVMQFFRNASAAKRMLNDALTPQK